MKIKYLILPSLFALVLGGCTLPFVGKTVEEAKQTLEQKAAEQEILKNCTYDKAICDYMVAQMRAFESGLTMTTKVTGGDEVFAGDTVTKMDGKGNMQSVTTKDGKEVSSMVVFNSATYIKDYADGQWMKMTSDNDSEITKDIPDTIEDFKESFNVEDLKMIYTKLGQESCGAAAVGLTCDIYEMSELDEEETYKSKMWIDTKEHLMRKMEMTMDEGMVSSVVYSYEPVSVNEPSPVKEFTIPSFDTGDGSMPSQKDIQKMMQELPDFGE